MKELPDLVLAYGNSDEFRYAILYFVGGVRCLRQIEVPASRIEAILHLCMSQKIFPKSAKLTCTVVSCSTRTVRYSSDEPGTGAFHTWS